MTEAGRQCVFCGNPADSKEHVFPKWIAKMFASLGPGIFDHELDNTTGARARLQWSDTKAVELKVRRVCQSCNTGWMSDLEVQTKPVLAPLIRGSQGAITREFATLITAWMFKTTLVAEYAFPDSPHFTTAEASAFKERHEVPAISVQAGVHHGTGFDIWHRVRAWRDSNGRSAMCQSTLVLGKFLLNLFHVRHPESARYVQHPGASQDRLSILWPDEDFVWPPPEMFDSERLLELADADYELRIVIE